MFLKWKSKCSQGNNKVFVIQCALQEEAHFLLEMYVFNFINLIDLLSCLFEQVSGCFLKVFLYFYYLEK